MLITPHDELPYKFAFGPLNISIFEINPSGRLSNRLRPSGVVSGIPSTISLIPLIPKADLAPKPLIEILISWEKLFDEVVNTPGVFLIKSENEDCELKFLSSVKLFKVTDKGACF